METRSVDSIKTSVQAILPNPRSRKRQLSIYAEALDHIDSKDPNGWLTHVREDRIRLLCGGLIVLTLMEDEIWLPIDASSDTQVLSRLPSWEWDTTDYPEYQRPPSRNGTYRPLLDPRGDWQRIEEAHHSFLDRLLSRGYRHDPRSIERSRQDAALLDHLNAVLARPVPFGDSAQLPEELSPRRRYWEGSSMKVTVNRFERDPAAREACLKHHGRRCKVCGMSFAERYCDEMAEIIHVHHLTPLSEVRDGYEPDPAKDMVPVCPNCHAAIHAHGGVRSIEEVRDLMAASEKAG